MFLNYFIKKKANWWTGLARRCGFLIFSQHQNHPEGLFSPDCSGLRVSESAGQGQGPGPRVMQMFWWGFRAEDHWHSGHQWGLHPSWLALPCSTCSMTLRAFLAAHPPMETWSSMAALVERESTDEGWHRALFSETARGQRLSERHTVPNRMTCQVTHGSPKRSSVWATLSRSSWSLSKH